jgi:hypothetical protein
VAFVSSKFVPTQKSEVAVYKPMIPDFPHLPTQTRYEIICAFHASHPESIRDTARFFGICENTVRSALKWAEHPIPIDQAGRPRVLEQEHKDYIERRTTQDRRISCKALAAEMRGIYPALRHLSQATVWQC